MLTAIFFLLLNLLMFASAAAQTSWPVFSHRPWAALGTALILYVIWCFFLYHQNRRWAKERTIDRDLASVLSNVEIAIFFLIYYFVLGAQRPLLLVAAPFGLTVSLLLTLILYLFALYIIHYAYDKISFRTSFYALQLVIPFAAPFLLFVFLGDLESLIPFKALSAWIGVVNTDTVEAVVNAVIDCAAIALALILAPPLAVIMWGCKPLEDPSLMASLDALCRRAHFRHGGFRIWKILPQACTAAIIGIAPRLRYILFTPRLLSLLSPRAIEAVLAHEIGHSKHHHLLVYPFIVGGMGIFGMAASYLFYPFFEGKEQPAPAPLSPGQEAFLQIAIFIGTIIAIAFYLRIVFGYFSRLFERQADLYALELGLPADAMIEALDTLASVSGNIHDVPNWHHFSIRERIDFLKRAANQPELIEGHQRLVRMSILIFLALLALAAAYIIIVEIGATS